MSPEARSADASATAEPPPPRPCARFEVVFHPPDVGWMGVAIRFDDRVVEFPTSYVFDPYQALKDWLETIATGGAARIAIDPEGWFVILEAQLADGDDQARFTVTMEHTGPGDPENWKTFETDEDGSKVTIERACDVTLPRRRLVAAFYDGLMERWEQPSPDAFWNAWLNTSPESWEANYDEPYGFGRYSMRSERVEAYLAKASAVKSALDR